MMITAGLTSLAQVGIKEWLFATTPDICTSLNANSLTCPQMRSFFTASVIWGVIGPQRLFGSGAVYTNLLYAFLAGGMLPILLWMYLQRVRSLFLLSRPRGAGRLISTPLLALPTRPVPLVLAAGHQLPDRVQRPAQHPRRPAAQHRRLGHRQLPHPCVRSLFFSPPPPSDTADLATPPHAEYLWRRRHFRLWSKVRRFWARAQPPPLLRPFFLVLTRSPAPLPPLLQYNYVLSVGLDTGTVIGVLIIFLCLQLPKDGTLSLNWWGNLVFTQSRSLGIPPPLGAPVPLLTRSALPSTALDATGTRLQIPPVTGFGPTTVSCLSLASLRRRLSSLPSGRTQTDSVCAFSLLRCAVAGLMSPLHRKPSPPRNTLVTPTTPPRCSVMLNLPSPHALASSPMDSPLGSSLAPVCSRANLINVCSPAPRSAPRVASVLTASIRPRVPRRAQALA